MEWISVKDRLPEDARKVLTCSPDGGINVDSNINSDPYRHQNYWIDGKAYGYKITHWMPLPEPPQIEGD